MDDALAAVKAEAERVLAVAPIKKTLWIYEYAAVRAALEPREEPT